MPGRSNSRRAGSRLRARLCGWRPALNLALVTGLLVAAEGCTRRYYRTQVDKEVGEVLAQKDKYPAWKIENWWVYPHPMARFADPSNPDRPPRPPDDPASFDLSPNPQHTPKAGVERIEGRGYLELIARWDKENRERKAREEAEAKRSIEPPLPGGPGSGSEEQEAAAGPPVAVRGRGPAGPAREEQVAWVPVADPPAAARGQEPPAPAPRQAPAGGAEPYPVTAIPSQRDAIAEARARSLLDISGRPAYLLTLDQAAELAMFNSRQFQDQRENLYLASLPVTLERFSFMAQFFAASEAMRTYAGRTAPGGPENNWSLNNGIGRPRSCRPGRCCY
jgi:hypothetical protein